MKRIARVLATSLVAAGCGPKVPPAVPAASAPSLAARFAQGSVDHTRFARRTLYTWTTHDQVVELGKTKQLLSRDESPTRGASYYEQVLDALARKGDPIAKLLYTTTYAKARFGWATAWPTRRGWPGETYGDELIRVTLKPDAVVLGLAKATGGFVAHDLSDRAIPIETVLAQPERIAAVFFVSDAAEAQPGLPKASALYREYILCNEAMIEGWAVGTDEVARELADEAKLIDALATYVTDHPSSTPPIADVWAQPATATTPERAFAAALAFANGWYQLDVDALTTLAKALRETPRSMALAVAPSRPFPGVGGPRPAPRVMTKPSGQVVGTYAPPPPPKVP